MCLGDFQGPSLTVVLEGATLSMENVCGLQFPPPWKIQGNALNYGLGLVSSYFICDLLTIVSSGYLFIFDPLGLALATTSNSGPAAKLFSLIGEVQSTFYSLSALSLAWHSCCLVCCMSMCVYAYTYVLFCACAGHMFVNTW